MAPRRSGGSSSGSSGDDFSSSSTSDNPWFHVEHLAGSHFSDGFVTATFAFDILFTVCLLGITIWKCTVRKRSDAAQDIISWSKSGVALFFTLISFLYIVIQIIISEVQASVTNIYFVVSAIITASGYIGNIWLLITIYALAYHCFTQPDGKPGSTSKKGILRAHYVLCGILFALFLATFAFQIRDVVVQVQDYGLYYTRIRRSIPVSYKLDVAYDALTFVASVEILIGSLWGVVRSRGQGQPLKPGILFLTLVAFPFFIRRVIVLGFDAAFELSLTRYATAGAYLAQTIVVGFAIVVSFVGIILVVKELEKNSVPPGWNPDGFAPNGQPPSNGPMNGYPQGYGYPQTQPFGYYPQGQGPPPNMQYANAQSQQQQQGYPSHLQSQHHQADSPRTQQGDTSQPQQQQQQHHAGPDTGLAVPPSSTSGATATATNEMSADEQQTPELYNQNQQQRRLYEMNS